MLNEVGEVPTFKNNVSFQICDDSKQKQKQKFQNDSSVREVASENTSLKCGCIKCVFSGTWTFAPYLFLLPAYVSGSRDLQVFSRGIMMCSRWAMQAPVWRIYNRCCISQWGLVLQYSSYLGCDYITVLHQSLIFPLYCNPFSHAKLPKVQTQAHRQELVHLLEKPCCSALVFPGCRVNSNLSVSWRNRGALILIKLTDRWLQLLQRQWSIWFTIISHLHEKRLVK